MRRFDLIRWPLAVVYVIFISSITFLLIVLGYVISRSTWLPSGVERAYAGYLFDLLNLLLRPVDRLLPRVEGFGRSH